MNITILCPPMELTLIFRVLQQNSGKNQSFLPPVAAIILLITKRGYEKGLSSKRRLVGENEYNWLGICVVS